MALALSLGARGMGRVWPNPAVGCVIVNGGRVVGRGWTQPGGRPHAEVMALAQAGAHARGATVYVSLEPCAHHGKSPPCAEALIAAGVGRVVSAMTDPDPRVDGGGHTMLRAAGISVETGVMEAEARRDHAGFLLNRTEGRPMLTLKLAASLDGRIATATGESQWITGQEARRRVHAMRARHDAVLVGAGTARADNPSLTVRGLGVAHQPVRVVASRRLDLPENSQLAHSAGKVPVWLCHGPNAPETRKEFWQEAGARLIEIPLGPRRVLDPTALLSALGAEGITRVFCEGGGMLAGTLLGAGVVDELVAFTAGLALGAEGQPSLGAMGVEALGSAPRLELSHQQQVGADGMTVWRRHSL